MNRKSQQFHRLAILLIVGLILLPGQAQGVYTNAPDWLNEGGVPIFVPVGLSEEATGGLPVSTNLAGSLSDLTNLRPKLDIAHLNTRVGLISSGIDKSLFPEILSQRITPVAGTINADTVGYGSYAASALFELAGVTKTVVDSGVTSTVTSTVSISSYNVYPGGVFSPSTLMYALKWISDNASNLDVVLLGFSPTDFLDPITAAMSNNSWNGVFDAMLNRPSTTDDGPVIGIPLEGSAFNEQGNVDYGLVNSLRVGMQNYDLASRWITSINSKGLSVIVPAGDVGPNPQTVMGLANLPSVITVGGYNPAGYVSPKGSAGPSIDLKVKPDFLAPSGLVGVMPPTSKLAKLLKFNGHPEDGSLKPRWVEYPNSSLTTATAMADTTLSASTVAAMAAGALGAGGLRDPALQRGALYRAATHIDGVPIWRQGSGVLGGVTQSVAMPTILSATTEPLTLNHGDLGFQKEGVWNVTVTVSTGTVTTGATVTLTDFIGVDLFGKATTGTASSGDPPWVSATVNANGVTLTVNTSTNPLTTGLYCGSVGLDIAKATVTVDDDKTAVCLTTGFEPVGRVLEIHNQSVNDDSFMLSPGLPPAATVLNHPLMRLPIDPPSFGLITAISETKPCDRYHTATVFDYRETCDGHARLPRVMAGYYRVLEFSDYGGQTEFTVTNSTSGAAETVGRDIGSPITYSSFQTLLLPKSYDKDLLPNNPSCEENFGTWEDWAGHGDTDTAHDDKWKFCTEKLFVTATVRDPTFNWQYNRFLGGYNVSKTVNVEGVTTTSTADSPLINMGFFRKRTEGANIGRMIDIIDPCKDMTTHTFYSPQTAPIESIVSSITGDGPWTVGCSKGLDLDLLGGSGGGSSSVGWATAQYPFNIPIPNFSTHMSLNFAYKLTNSFILVVVQIGSETAIGLVTPSGTFKFPPGSPTIDTSKVPAIGQAEGKANFEFTINAKGSNKGRITFALSDAYVKTPDGSSHPTGISKAEIQDDPLDNKTLSFELSTFGVNPWPAMNFPNKGNPEEERLRACNTSTMQDCGHVFGFHSQYSPYTADVTGTWTGGQIGKWVKDDDPLSKLGHVVPDNCRDMNNETRKARVCEDWTMIVHSPKLPNVVPDGIPGYPTTDLDEYQMQTGSSLMDVLDVSSTVKSEQYSFVNELINLGGINLGGRLYVPAPRYTTATATLAYKYLPKDVPKSLFSRTLKSNGTHFELLNFPIDVLRAHPKGIQVCINDGPARSIATSTVLFESVCEGHDVPHPVLPNQKVWEHYTKLVPQVPKVTSTAGARVPLRPYVPYAKQATLWYWPAPPALPEPPP
ncbi:MAG: hypothetical protein ABIS18_09460 [Actinomycetota bacterium]